MWQFLRFRSGSENEPQEAAGHGTPQTQASEASQTGCLLCKPSKLTANKKADRARARRDWRGQQRRAW
jgi:hypothetical protein